MNAETRKSPAAAADDTARTPRFSLRLTIIAFAMVLLGLLWGAVVVKLDTERKLEIANSMRDTSNLARAFEEHAKRAFRDADQLLLFIRHDYGRHGSKSESRELIRSKLVVSRIYHDLNVFDERGNQLTGASSSPPANIADLEHFQIHAAQDTGRLFISKPVVARTTGKIAIVVSRRINKPDLSFGGVAVAIIDPDYFSQFYAQFDLGQHSAVTLIGRDDLIVRARRSGSAATLGQDVSKSALADNLRARNSGSYVTKSAVDGLTRIDSYRALADYPLVVFVGFAEDEELADFSQRARQTRLAATTASLLILAFSAFLLLLVSRRELAAKALRDSERRYHQLVHALPAAVYTCDARGHITLYNEAAAALWGRAPEPGKDLWCGSWKIYEPDGRPLPPEQCPMALAIREGRAIRGTEILVERPDGARFNVLPHPQPLLDAAGTVTGAINMLIDITERKRAEQDSAWLAAIIENSNDAIVSRDMERRILSWNTAAERLFGYAAAEVIGRSIGIMIPSDQMQDAERGRAALAEGHPIAPRDVVRRTKNGQRIDVSLSQSPVKNGRGEIIAVSLNFQDISERKRAEAERMRLAAIVESNADAIVSRGMDGIIQSWNAAAARMFGWTAQEALGQPITILVPPDRRGELRPLIDRVVAGEIVGAVESEHMRKDGVRICSSTTFSAIQNADSSTTGIAFIFRDITEQKQLQSELRHKSELTQLLASLAHAANAATTSEMALQSCLEKICAHGRWRIGHVTTFKVSARVLVAASHLWNYAEEDRARLTDFVYLSEHYDYAKMTGPLTGKMLRQKQPAWIDNIMDFPYRGRFLQLQRQGIRSGFGFPVVVQEEVIALIECFSNEQRPTDPMLLENMSILSAQLARLIERDRAERTLKTSETRLRTILDAEPECVKVIAADGSPLEINRAGLAMFEAESVEHVHRHGLLNFVLPEQQTRFSEHFAKALTGESSMLEFQIVGLKGTRRWLESHATSMQLPDSGAPAVLAVTRDITERKRAQEQITYLSQYDVLTGLPNRNLFRDRLDVAIARSRRQGEVVGIMLLNLDRFKLVNENLGMEAGDDLLRQVATRLKATLREVDTIARLGSDEFAILAEDMPASADVIAIAEKLVEVFTLPFMLVDSTTEVVTVPSIGITIHPNSTDDCDKLLEHAETAMQHLKREGGGGWRIYENESVTHHGQRFDLEMQLRHALERGELELHYQPKVQLLTGTITGVEALLRWNNPDLGAVSPTKFIPIAEESGLIIPIGEWVLRTACAQMQSWHAQGHVIGISVNLSPRQFRQKDLASTVASALRETGLAPEHLELEITEGTAMANAEHAIKVLGELHALDVKLSVDDFGTGYSSLAYLKRFPLDTLKIDRSFVIDVGHDLNSEAIMRATIALAHSLQLKVVAEGVETETQRDFLAAAGCNEIQGYLYSRPLPAVELLAWLGAQNGQSAQSWPARASLLQIPHPPLKKGRVCGVGADGFPLFPK